MKQLPETLPKMGVSKNASEVRKAPAAATGRLGKSTDYSQYYQRQREASSKKDEFFDKPKIANQKKQLTKAKK